MSEKLFFDDSADSLVKDWLKGAVASEETVKATSKHIDAGNKKHGLGYEDKKPKLDAKDALLATRIRNPKKRQAAEDAVELHGLVEDEETSRTAIASKKQRTQPAQKQKQLKVVDTKTSSVAGPSKTESEVLAQNTSTEVTAPAKLAGPSQSNVEKPKRRRPKTRSKQKNIRHDHRSEEQRPEHLRLGSSNYAGRPLTEETKIILAQKKPVAVEEKPMSKSQLKKQKKKNEIATQVVEEVGCVIDKGNSTA